MARLAAERARSSRDALEEVWVAVEALEQAADPEVVPDKLDREFHRAVARLTGNEYLFRLLEPLWETMSQPVFTTLRAGNWSADHARRTASEHRTVYEALRAGDPELAAFAMERHLRAVMAGLFGDEAFENPPGSV